ncbi:MAG TPA: sugar ABC transporter substrate-binding protein [Solirubrobacteraceae bacterium]
MRVNTKVALAVASAVAALALGACGDDDDDGGGGGAGTSADGKSGKIALLLPETKTTRYETADRPGFEAKVKELCADCEIIYSNADQDAAKQQSQAEAAITSGAKVMVLDPVDSASAAAVAKRAKAAGIPVVSYDRLILNAEVDYYVSFDNVEVGKLQGQSLIEQLGGSGDGKKIVMINGAPTDNNAKLFKQGAHSVLDKSGVDIAKEYDTPDWSPDKAQTEMEQALTAVGKDIDGFYAANDGTAGGAIAALKGAGVDPKGLPSTGQDAELAAIQRIIAGEQGMTVYKAIKPEAEAAAQLAVALVRGEEPPAGLVNGETDNGAGKVPSVLLKPTAVTKDNVADTVIKDGFTKASELCTGRYARFCTDLGIS